MWKAVGLVGSMNRDPHFLQLEHRTYIDRIKAKTERSRVPEKIIFTNPGTCYTKVRTLKGRIGTLRLSMKFSL